MRIAPPRAPPAAADPEPPTPGVAQPLAPATNDPPPPLPDQPIEGGQLSIATSSLVYLCGCDQSRWDKLCGVDLVRKDKLQLCHHARAVKKLHEQGGVPYVSSASAGAIECINDADFHSDAPTVVLLHVELTSHRYVRDGKRRHMQVSVPLFSCRGGKGDPVIALNRRAIVSPVARTRMYICNECNNGGHKKSKGNKPAWMCEHLSELSEWLKTEEGLETYDELGLQRFWLPNAHKPVEFEDDSDLHTCISYLPIVPGPHVKAVRDRLNCGERSRSRPPCHSHACAHAPTSHTQTLVPQKLCVLSPPPPTHTHTLILSFCQQLPASPMLASFADVVGFKPKCASCITNAAPVCVHCVPDIPTEGDYARCKCGAAWDDSDPVLAGFRLPGVVTLSSRDWSRDDIEMFYRQCSDPSCTASDGGRGRLAYDGGADGLFNLSNQSLFTHEVLSDYWDQVVTQALTFSQLHANLKVAHEKNVGDRVLPSRQTVRAACWTYLRMLAIDYAAKFDCPLCSLLPHWLRVLIVDGVTCGFRSDFAQTAIDVDPPTTTVPE
jgi:hypothetical protein